MSEIVTALRDLSAGVLSIEDVEDLFRQRTWMRRLPTFEELMSAADRAPEPAPYADFTEVEHAYALGVISIEQYIRLAQAVTSTARPDSED